MLRDIVGLREDVLDLPNGGSLSAVFDHYASRFPRLRELSQSIVLAHNQRFADPSTLLSEDDEVALLPPVSGGSGCFTHEISDPAGHFFAITRYPIDARALAARLQRGEDGALVTFEGVTRNNTKGRSTRFLEYECYEAMAIKLMADIGREAAANHAIGRIGMIHRLGRLEIGEASVVIVAAAPHRRPAFEAALEGINRLKKLVPIWKKEHFADGEVWVDGEWDDSVLKVRV
jgi:molybdopterin synthase catalytic subunit/molybdopterin converting factor small subunit